MDYKSIKGFTIDEYYELLNCVKECYGEEKFKDITIVDEEIFSYTPDDKEVSIVTHFIQEECEVEIPEKFLIKYINETYDLNLPNTPKFWSIFSFLHELGHHMDLSFRTEEDFMIYHQKNMTAYSKLGRKSNRNYYRISKCKADIEMYEALNDEEMLKIIRDKMSQLEKDREDLDYEYRRLPSESAADDWAVDFIKNHLCKYEKYNY